MDQVIECLEKRFGARFSPLSQGLAGRFDHVPKIIQDGISKGGSVTGMDCGALGNLPCGMMYG